MSKLLSVTILLFALGVNPIYAQSSEIRTLKTKRENIQKLVRAYQDSLADLDFIISELESGNSVDYSETIFYKKSKIQMLYPNYPRITLVVKQRKQ